MFSVVFFSVCVISYEFWGMFRWMVRLKFFLMKLMMWFVMFNFILICGNVVWKCGSNGSS